MTINEVKPLTEYHSVAFDEWRKNYKETIVSAVNEVPCVKTTGYDCYIRGTEDDIIWIIKPRNTEDIKALNMYADMITYLSEGTRLTEDDINKVIIINLGMWGEVFRVKRLQDYLKEIEQKYNELAEEVDKVLIEEQYV